MLQERLLKRQPITDTAQRVAINTDLASSFRLLLYTDVERPLLKGSEDGSICSASARRLFLSRVMHSWSHSSLSKQRPLPWQQIGTSLELNKKGEKKGPTWPDSPPSLQGAGQCPWSRRAACQTVCSPWRWLHICSRETEDSFTEKKCFISH